MSLTTATKIAGVIGGLSSVAGAFSFYKQSRAASHTAATRLDDELNNARMTLLKYLLDPVHDGETHSIDLATISPFSGMVDVTLDSRMFKALLAPPSARRDAAGSLRMTTQTGDASATMSSRTERSSGSKETQTLQVYAFAVAGVVDASVRAAQSVDTGVLWASDADAYVHFVQSYLLGHSSNVKHVRTAPSAGAARPGAHVIAFIQEQAKTEAWDRHEAILRLWKRLGLYEDAVALAQQAVPESMQRSGELR